REQGGFLGSIRMSEELAARNGNVFLPCQFSNEANADAHMRTTGPEIWYQLRLQGLTPDAFVAGVGTGGTVMGVGRYLRKCNPAVRVYPLEPAESPTISTGHKVGQHRIQGISDEFIPALVRLDELEPVVEASDGDSIIMAQKLASVGLAVGISSGANIIGALKIQDALGSDKIVVTVLSDSNKKYLSTDLMRAEAVKPGYLAPETEVLGFEAAKRVCALCCEDPACSEHANREHERAGRS
ncbi:MAG: pyridoxal-phosphate dependent enzyme, partial [Rhodospirillaceae bacterium]